MFRAEQEILLNRWGLTLVICPDSCVLTLEVTLGTSDYQVLQDRDFPGGPVVRNLPPNEGGVGSSPGQKAKIPGASGPKKQNIKQKQYCNKFSKDKKRSTSRTADQYIG